MRSRVPRVLVVEDNLDIARLVRFHLRDLPAEVTLAADGVSGLATARDEPFDMLVLDLSLPGISGTQLLEQVRAAGNRTPALILTGQAVGSNAALDALQPIEWMQKPFGVVDLVARAQRMLQSAGSPGNAASIEHGPLHIDLERRQATLAGAPLALDDKMFDLLALLAGEPTRVFARRELRQYLWGDASDIDEHAVNALISRLRAQIETDPHAPLWIRPGPSGGYRFGGGATA